MGAPLTKTEQVLKVLKAGGKATVGRGAGGIATLRDKDGTKVAAWQNAIKAAAKIHGASMARKAGEALPGNCTTTAQVRDLALRIADISVRSEIELFAHGHARGLRIEFDTSKPCEHDDNTPEDNAANLRRVSDAVRYIDLRGDAFPWRMVRDPSFPNMVHFEEKRP